MSSLSSLRCLWRCFKCYGRAITLRTPAEDTDRSSNPQNGTIVDRGVTEVRNWDFFLQAHTALNSTARPAHTALYYYVVHDEIFRSREVRSPHKNAADALEELTQGVLEAVLEGVLEELRTVEDHTQGALEELTQGVLEGVLEELRTVEELTQDFSSYLWPLLYLGLGSGDCT